MELPILKHLALVLFVTLAGTAHGHAMGGPLPTATQQLQMQSALDNTIAEPSSKICSKPITAVETGRIFCPIRTPGQVIEHALDEQLKKEAP